MRHGVAQTLHPDVLFHPVAFDQAGDEQLGYDTRFGMIVNFKSPSNGK